MINDIDVIINVINRMIDIIDAIYNKERYMICLEYRLSQYKILFS